MTNPILETVRENLSAAMAAKGVAPTVLSMRVGSSRTLVRDLLTKTDDVKLSTLCKLAAELEIDVGELLGLAGSAASRPTLNENNVAAMLLTLVPTVPKGQFSEKAAQALSVALIRGLELLSKTGSSHPSDDAVQMASAEAVARFREAFRS